MQRRWPLDNKISHEELERIELRKARAKNMVLDRQRAYWLTFNKESVAVQAVLKDLAKFCRATDSTFHTDERVHALTEGRREVWLRIQNHLKLSPDDLFKILGGSNV